MPSRRSFLLASSLMAASAVVNRVALAESPHLAESDAQAKTLGYNQSAAKVDKAKYPKFAAEQKCSSCALYQGKAGEAWGNCAIFPGNQVNAGGWCTAWAKKPA